MSLNVLLASSLLDLEPEPDGEVGQGINLRYRTGITNVDKDLPHDLFASGYLIGLGIDSCAIDKQVSLEIIVTHLLDHRRPQTGTVKVDQASTAAINPSVFIISPPTQATSSIQRIYQLLQSRTATPNAGPQPLDSSSTGLEELLNQVSLLQFLDIAGLSQSLSEVFTSLTEGEGSPTKSIVCIQGLTGSITTTQRRSGAVQTAALASSILKGVKNMVRSTAKRCTCLGLIEVDVGWVSDVVGSGVLAAEQRSPAATGPGGPTTLLGMNTAFASRTGKILRLTGISPLLGKIIEDEVDVLIALHDGDGRVGTGEDEKRIIEVVRDERAGLACAVGSWTLW